MEKHQIDFNMAKFKCKKCKSTKEIHKWSTILVNGKWKDKES